MSKSKSDSPIPEDVVWGNLSPKSRLKAYMPEKRKTSSSKKKYNIPEGIDEEEMNEALFKLDETLDLPVAPSGMLFPNVPKEKPKGPTLELPAAPTTPLPKKPSKQKLTVLEQFALKRTKLAEKTENQKKKNRTIRTRLDALVSRFKKGGTRKSTLSTFKKGGAKSRTRKSRAKSRSRKYRRI